MLIIVLNKFILRFSIWCNFCQEFKLNPNAMSFTPSFTPLRPPSPVIQGPLYVPGMMVPVPPIQTVPVGANSQSTGRYPPYSPGAISYMPPPPYTPVSGALVPPPLSGGQPAMKMLPQLQQPVSLMIMYPMYLYIFIYLFAYIN
jgi:hypothetical protein